MSPLKAFTAAKRKVYENLYTTSALITMLPWQIAQVARHPQRPRTLARIPSAVRRAEAYSRLGRPISTPCAIVFDNDRFGSGRSFASRPISATLALPVTRSQSIKIYGITGYNGHRHHDFDAVGVAWQYRWGGGL